MDGEQERPRDRRTFPERVERVNVAFLVNVPVGDVPILAQETEETLNKMQGKLIFVKQSNGRMVIVDGDAYEDMLIALRGEEEAP